MKKFVIAIDFDGTIVTNKYPEIGNLKRNAKRVINLLHEYGHEIIINSCREGAECREMIDFLNDNEIKFHEVNNNLCHRIEKYGNDCRKIGADIYIDDKAFPNHVINWNKILNYILKKMYRKPVIICIVGESGSGKTTIAEYIEQEHGIKMMESYTDRPMRFEGERGHTFVTKEEFDLFKRDDMIAYTEFGGNRYCCLKEDVQEFNTYVIDERGLIYLRDNFSDIYEIKAIRVFSEKDDRIERVGEERVKRDEGMFNLLITDEIFDFRIINSFMPLEIFKNVIDKALETILEK